MAEKRKLAAILAADVVGYSKLAATDEERTVARLRALRSDLIDPTIALHNGRVVKRTGDGIIIEFRSVVDAVRCAIEMQNGMVERNAGLPPDRRIEFRVGVHLGDVIEESDGDLMGDGVNIATRMEGIAEPGGLCLSEDAYRQVRDRLNEEFTDLGEKVLKNIARPVRAYAIKAGSAVPAPAPHAPTPEKSGPPRLSIVVLPFTNLSGDPNQEYFADAITENLTTALSRIRNSFVIARNTAFTFKGKNTDAREISKELGVRYVLEGSVQRDRDRVRVNAQLIDGETGAHLLADQFDTITTDLLQMQDEIVARLANSLGYEFVRAEAQRSVLSKKVPEAEDLAMQCLAAVRKVGYFGKEAEEGYRLCEQALDIDPDNLLALTILATKFYQPILLRRSADPQAELTRAGELVSRALSIDPNYSFAHHQKGQVLRAERRFEEAIVEYERAIVLDQNNAVVYGIMGETCNEMGQFERAIELLDKTIRLSPRDPSLSYWYYGKGYAHFALQQEKQAIEWERRSIAINPNWSWSRGLLAAALALTGDEAEARNEEQRRVALSPFKTVKALQGVAPPASADPGVRAAWDRLIEGLRKAGLPEE